MTVGLFIPCYIDQFYPQVGIATLRLLRRQGLSVDYPEGQTCCGQPMANAGCAVDALPAMRRFVEIFADYDYIVMPSGSCALHVREHFAPLGEAPAVRRVRERTYELSEFLTDIVAQPSIDARFPHRVALHQSCHGLRGLRLGRPSERMAAEFSKPRRLLEQVRDLTFVSPVRTDECCGFGGTFAVDQPALSVKMGRDRIADYSSAGAEVITATDMSCLMHLEGIIRRQGSAVRVMHIAEILEPATATSTPPADDSKLKTQNSTLR